MTNAESRKLNTQKRNEDIRKRVNELHEQERLRFDDVVQRVCSEFYLTPNTLRRILN